MNIGSFLHRDQALYGVFNGETVAPASPGLIAQYPTLRDLLDAEKSEALKGSVNLSATIPIAEITFQPPIPNPRKIICVGMNYPKPYPVDGVAPPSPEHIILFGKESETLVGHGATLEVPRGTPADSWRSSAVRPMKLRPSSKATVQARPASSGDTDSSMSWPYNAMPASRRRVSRAPRPAGFTPTANRRVQKCTACCSGEEGTRREKQ